MESRANEGSLSDPYVSVYSLTILSSTEIQQTSSTFSSKLRLEFLFASKQPTEDFPCLCLSMELTLFKITSTWHLTTIYIKPLFVWIHSLTESFPSVFRKTLSWTFSPSLFTPLFPAISRKLFLALSTNANHLIASSHSSLAWSSHYFIS